MYFILAMDIHAMLGITMISQARWNVYEIDE